MRSKIAICLAASGLVACTSAVEPDHVAEPEPVVVAPEASEPEPDAVVEAVAEVETAAIEEVIEPVIIEVPEPAPVPEPVACGLDKSFVHVTREHGERLVHEGPEGELLFVYDYAVNTDGAATSYHPDDPYGSEGQAINTICNGANVTMPDGTKYNYAKCRELVAAFREARDGGWVGKGLPRFDFYGVAVDQASGKPCLFEEGPHEGYFVSTTSLTNPVGGGACNPERYLDSLSVPFIIYPGDRKFTSRGMGKRDIAALYHKSSGRMVFAVVGDRGPKWGLGEGSVAIAKVLGGKIEDPKTRRDTYGYGVKDIVTLVFPDKEMSAPYTTEAIQAFGREALEEWGGEERLQACLDLPGYPEE